MFKKLAADALGISDVGVIIAPVDYDKVDADDYLFREDGEKIFFLVKSKKDESASPISGSPTSTASRRSPRSARSSAMSTARIASRA